MRKVYCDMCGEEIADNSAKSCDGAFSNKEGLLVRVTVTAPSAADLCKPCVIKIITEGEVYSRFERR